MTWSGNFLFGDYWAAYAGPAGDNTLHAHAALQLSITLKGSTSISNEHSKEFSNAALIVRPGIKHRLHPISEVLLVLIEPQSTLAQYILGISSHANIANLHQSLLEQINLNATLETCLTVLLNNVPSREADLDKRLRLALKLLEDTCFDRSLASIAISVGISESRLRAIAKDELGVPLAKWILWQKLNRASQELASGADLADAALAGGFADQAHFTRTTRKLIGLTPGLARVSLR